MLLESIIDRIKTIPPLPDSIIKIEELYAQDNPNIKDLVKIVESDPILTANILSIANSPLYSFRNNIVSIQQAVTLFGMSNIRGFVLSTITNTFDLDMTTYGISNKEFQDISLLQSTLMFQWYMTISIEQSSILVPIAFLMDIGKVIIARELTQSEYKDIFTQMIEEGVSISETEKFFVGMTSAEVTALLLEHWNFHDTFVHVIKHSDEPYYSQEEYKVLCQAIDVVKTCINIKEPMSEDSFKEAKMKSLQYGLPVAKFIKTVQRIQEKISKER